MIFLPLIFQSHGSGEQGGSERRRKNSTRTERPIEIRLHLHIDDRSHMHSNLFVMLQSCLFFSLFLLTCAPSPPLPLLLPRPASLCLLLAKFFFGCVRHVPVLAFSSLYTERGIDFRPCAPCYLVSVCVCVLLLFCL